MEKVIHSGGPRDITAIAGWVHLELAARGALEAVGHCLRDEVGPLLNSAASNADGPGNRCAVIVEVSQYIGLAHTRECTAC